MSAQAVLGARLAGQRLGARFLTVSAVLSTTGVALAAIIERRGSPIRAADHTLLGAVFGIAVPLIAYATATRATRDGGLERTLDAVGRFGADRRSAGLGFVAVLVSWGALLSASLAAVGVMLARGFGDAAVAGDLAISVRIGALGGAVYICFFVLGAALHRRRFWMFSLLAADWVLGSTAAAVSAPWPRSHLRNLLGAEPVLGMTQGAASLALWGLLMLCLAGSLALTRR